MRATLAVLGLLAAAGAGASACGESAEPGRAGWLTVSLDSPSGDDGAVMLRITGAPVDSIDAPGLQLFSARLDSVTTRLVLTGTIGSGALARIRVPDVLAASRYAATLEQAAARGSYAQRDVAGYRVTIGD